MFKPTCQSSVLGRLFASSERPSSKAAIPATQELRPSGCLIHEMDDDVSTVATVQKITLANIPTGRYVGCMTSRPPSATAREKLLDAAVNLVRHSGFAGTSVDQLCAAAGVTKGAFFHHFASKEALGVAAAGHWLESTAPLFAAADFHRATDALARVLGYLDLRESQLEGGTDAFT